MQRIQDAMIVFEIEKIFEEKLNELYSRVNATGKIYP
jgi:hypothetical protein